MKKIARQAMSRWLAILLSCPLAGAGLGPARAADKLARPGVPAPMTELKPEATFELGDDPDWMAVGDDAVWISVSRQHAVYRIDAATNKVAAKVVLPGAPDDSEMAFFAADRATAEGAGARIRR